MPEAVAARQPAQAQRADPQRSAGRPERQGAVQARAGIERLQRALGNRGMTRLLRSGAIQAKLAVGPADDEYEREADRVADEVMRMPDPTSTVTAQRSTLRVQRVCPECEEEAQRSPLPIQRACQECEELQPKSSATMLSGPEQISRKCPKCEEKARDQTQEGDAVQRKSDPTDEKDEEEEGIVQAKSRGVILPNLPRS
jgi:hypothetical protein